jgi:DNA-binding transcriptional LysR family regulator
MALNLNLLRSFWHVAQAGSVSRAAQTAFISQPALSKAVQELEKQVGLPLFERGARGVLLTEAGQMLFDHARAIFAIEQEAEGALASFHDIERATLRIGATTTIATYVLPRFLALFQRAHPRVQLKISRDNTRRIEAALCAYELDVALVEGPPHDARLDFQAWREEELICIAAPGHSLAQKAEVTLEDLQQCVWVVREDGSGTREVVESALAPYGLPPQNRLEIGGAEGVKQAVAAGLGVAVVSREAAADQIALGKLAVVQIKEIQIRRPFYVLHLRGRPTSPAAKAFEKLLWTNESQPQSSFGQK